MSEREYAVVLQRGVDYSQFHQDMISSYGNDVVPQRTVDVANQINIVQS